jgi:tetratricopeptide (TPR) repeat protein
MRGRPLWRERVLPLLAFPGGFALLIALEQVVLAPRSAERGPGATLSLWERHAADHPGFAPSRGRLGEERYRAGDHAGARAEFERALQLDPAYEPAVIGLNAAIRNLEGREAAIAQLEAYFAEHPECQPCAQNLAADHFALDDLDAAFRYIQPVVARRTYVMPGDYGHQGPASDGFLLAGRIYEAKGLRDEAAGHYRTALRRYARNPVAHFRLGRLELERDPAAAAGHFERLVALSPGEARGYLWLARARLAAGRRGDALAALDEGERVLAGAPPDVRGRWREAYAAERTKARGRL